MVRRALAFSSCLLAGCALFTDLTGYSDPPKKPTTDAGFVGDAQQGEPPRVEDDAGKDPGDSAPSPSCSATPKVTYEETFAGGFGEFTPLSSSPERGYPRHGAWDSSPAALLLPLEIEDGGTPEMFQSLWAGIWRFKEVPLVAFDIEVEAYIGCPLGDACGDGFAIQWTTMQTTDTIKANALTGGGLGLALHTSGGAIAADLHPNPEHGDTTDRSVQVIELKGSENDLYPWVAASTPKTTDRAWHKYKITMRNGQVSVDFDSLVDFMSANILPIEKGMIGISTGTGGLINGVAVKNFKGRFYDCTPP